MGPRVDEFLMSLVRREMWRWEGPLRAFRARHGVATDKLMIWEGQHSPHGCLLLFDEVLAAPQPDWPVPAHLCGAALHDGMSGDQALLERLPAASERPIVFALGSAAVWMGQDFFRAAIRAAVELERPAILLTGKPWPGELPPPGVHAVDYLPYSRVFPRAAALVHQAGIGTLAQALRAGVPQLITPVGFDQPDNAARAARLGVARVLPFQRVTARRLQQALAALLSDSGAHACAQHVARALDGQGALRAAQAIEGVLAGAAPPRRLEVF
jgi:hypothetical protein